MEWRRVAYTLVPANVSPYQRQIDDWRHGKEGSTAVIRVITCPRLRCSNANFALRGQAHHATFKFSSCASTLASFVSVDIMSLLGDVLSPWTCIFPCWTIRSMLLYTSGSNSGSHLAFRTMQCCCIFYVYLIGSCIPTVLATSCSWNLSKFSF